MMCSTNQAGERFDPVSFDSQAQDKHNRTLLYWLRVGSDSGAWRPRDVWDSKWNNLWHSTVTDTAR